MINRYALKTVLIPTNATTSYNNYRLVLVPDEAGNVVLYKDHLKEIEALKRQFKTQFDTILFGGN